MRKRYLGVRYTADRTPEQQPSNGPCLKCGRTVRHKDPDVRICIRCAEEAYEEQSKAARQEWRRGE